MGSNIDFNGSVRFVCLSIWFVHSTIYFTHLYLLLMSTWCVRRAGLYHYTSGGIALRRDRNDIPGVISG